MCAQPGRNPPGRCYDGKRIRSVPKTRWELPIPGSYPYWDKICGEIEKNKLRVRYPFRRCTLADSTVYGSFNSDTVANIDENRHDRVAFLREPLVKISPPTPVRELPPKTGFDEVIVENALSGNDFLSGADRVDFSIDSRESIGSLSGGDTRFSKVTCEPADPLLNVDKVYPAKACPLHKYYPPIQFFDDNLKDVLSRKYDKSRGSGDGLSNFSKIPPQKSRLPFHPVQTTVSDKLGAVESGKSENLESRNVLNSRSWQKYYKKASGFDKKWSKHSKLAILEKNINSMLSIPKLNEIRVGQELSSNKVSIGRIDFENNIGFDERSKKVGFKSESEKTLSASHLSPVNYSKAMKASLDESLERTEKCVRALPEFLKGTCDVSPKNTTLFPTISNESLVRSQSAKYKLPKKSRNMRIQKMDRTVSSYSKFNKPVSTENLDTSNNDREPLINILPSKSKFQNINRQSLQVPTFKSSTAGHSDNENIDFISSLREFSISRDDEERTKKVKLSRATPRLESIDRSSRSNDPSEKEDARASRSEGVADREIDSTENRRSRERRSLEYSVRYAYRALKFLTKNKNLDFSPKAHVPSDKSTLSSGASSSSFDLSEFTEANETATRTRMSKSDSSTTSYESIRNRLREKALQYLGPNNEPSRAKTMPKTSGLEDSELSNVRITSGPSSRFEKPILKNLSSETLKKIPGAAMLPRRNHDRCLACLHRTFEDPVKVKRELPLATMQSVLQESCPEVSDSESSSITVPDLERLTIDREIENNAETKATEVSQDTEIRKVSPLEQPAPTVNSLDNTSRSTLKVSEIILPQSSSSKDSQASKSASGSYSVTSIGSRASSISGQTSESEEVQVPIGQCLPASKYFVSCHVPLNLQPTLEHLKALKYKKAVSMRSRSASAVDEVDDETDYKDSSEESLIGRTRSRKDDGNSKKRRRRKRSARDELSWKNDNFETKLERESKGSIDDVVGPGKAKVLKEKEEPVEKLDEVKESSGLVEEQSGHRTGLKTLREPDERQVSLVDKHSKPFGKKVPTSASFDDLRILQSPDSKKNVELMQKRSKTSVKLNITSVDHQPDNAETYPKRFDSKIIGSADSFDPSSSLEFGSSGFSSESSAVVDNSQGESTKLSELNRTSVLNDKLSNIVKQCAANNLSAFETLKTLSDEFLREIFIDRDNISDSEVKRSARLARNLIKLLVESKRYLDPIKFPTDIEFSSEQPPSCNSRQLRRVLPPRSYNLIAPILGVPKWLAKESFEDYKFFIKSHRYSRSRRGSFGSKKSSVGSIGMVVHPPSGKGRVFFENDETYEHPKLSAYALFLAKPRRKAVTWRPLREEDLLGYDPEATLNMRATRVTNKICEDFCRWLSSLGGVGEDRIDEEVIRDMFEIDFSADTCRTMQVLVEEMPMVPTAVALTRNSPAAGELALTRRHLIRDAKAERRPKRMTGFGSALPREIIFVPPNNRVEEKWLQCENVPRDLETMDAVWKGITHLDSVKGFLKWLRDHPNVKPPKVLKEVMLSKSPASRLSQDEDGFMHLELNLDQIQSLKVGDNDNDLLN